ncbi:SIS domain-containing protein [Salinicola avicenniae]|uniref:SIS domain-containing protein n=1 Tax=Salinicola avicenniae TaxID=2916836 RepID=UPI0020747A11|nr:MULTISPECIES: SIS domain-containing protein [unclassified Salinicola]
MPQMSASWMQEEALSAPQRIQTQWQCNREFVTALAAELRQFDPVGGLTVARGSSDHAASYFAYLCMKHLGLPVASVPPSLTTLASAPWRVSRHLALAISQSGASPDLVATQQALAGGGARTLALVNANESPLAAASDSALSLQAGEERSVAATKSFLATLSASAHLIAAWAENDDLLEAIQRLPTRLEQAASMEWQAAVTALVETDRLLVVGRGAGLAVAQEAALKFKETCSLQAEAFSAAEVRHGPMALIEPGYPVLVFAPPGPEQRGLLELAAWLESVGARVLVAADAGVPRRHLPLIDAGHDDLQALSVIQSFYLMAAQLAQARGQNPDHPRHLQKVTRTL